jgi:hypothetical protein
VLAVASRSKARSSGAWDLAKLNTEVWIAGDKIYWDNANARATNAPAAGARLIGYANARRCQPVDHGPRASQWRRGASVDDDAAPAPRSYATVGAQVYTAADILGGIIVRDTNGASRTDAADGGAARRGDSWRAGRRCRPLPDHQRRGRRGSADHRGRRRRRVRRQPDGGLAVIGQNVSKTLTIRFTNVTAPSPKPTSPTCNAKA